MAVYRRKVQKSLLPHLGEVLQTLKLEDDKLSRDPRVSETDVILIRKQIADVQREISLEKKETQALVQKIYDTWKKIENLRKEEQKFTSSQ